MIVEMRTYSLVPGSTERVLERIGRALPSRMRLSPLGAMWHSDTGRLDQIIHLWPFEDMAHRTQIRARFSELPDWPVGTGDDMVESDSRVMKPVAFSPPLEPRRLGRIYEICTDAMRPQALARLLAAWEAALPSRTALSPLAGAWQSEIGPLGVWTHIWAYDNYEHRERVRSECAAQGIWPAAGDTPDLYRWRHRQIVLPASYSPLS